MSALRAHQDTENEVQRALGRVEARQDAVEASHTNIGDAIKGLTLELREVRRGVNTLQGAIATATAVFVIFFGVLAWFGPAWVIALVKSLGPYL